MSISSAELEDTSAGHVLAGAERPALRPLVRLSYIPCLDGIRACAFLLVFVSHSGYESTVPGGLGVTIFFP
jgi:hypothetical protein